jgi:hypothetical protein
MDENLKKVRLFISDHRKDIDKLVHDRYPEVGRLNDEERLKWMATDDRVSLWAAAHGIVV